MGFCKVFYTILNIIFCLGLCAQTVPTIQYNTSNGLPSSSVYKVFQLKDSTYIICTSEGMLKYDGYKFIKENPKNINYPQSIVEGVFLNDTTILYQSYREGLYFYDLKSKQATKEQFRWHKTLRDSFSQSERQVFFIDNEIYLCVLFNDENKTIFSSLVYDIKTNKYRLIKNISDLKVNGNQAYYLKNDTIFKYTKTGNETFCVLKAHNQNRSSAFCFDKNSVIYISNHKSIFKIKNKKTVEEIKLHEIVGNEIIQMQIDNFDNLWIVTDDYHFYKFKNGTLSLIEDGTLKHPFIYIDHNQNLLMTSYTDGLSIYYNTFIKNYGVKEGVKNKSINKIRQIDDKTFFCTNNGYYTLENNQLKHTSFPSADIPYIYDVVKFKDWYVLATTGKTTIQAIDKNTFVLPRRAIYTCKNNWQLHSGWNNHIYIDKNFDVNNANSVTGIETIFLPDTFPKNNYVIGFYQHSDSMVYTNTSVGLFDVNIFNKSFKLISQIKGKVNHIEYNRYKNEYIFCTDNGTFIKPVAKNWNSAYVLNIPKANKTNCSAIDLRGRLWIGTPNGLYILNNNSTKKLTTEFGLLSNEISALCFDSIKNEMYVGTNNGFSVIDIEQFDQSNLNAPKITIHSIIAGNDTIYQFNNYSFLPKQNSIEICLGKLLYPNIKAVKIKYALDGNWSETEFTDKLKFTSLSGDEHTFEIKASLDGINWSRSTKVHFTIQRPFYKSVWFYITVLLCSLMGIVFISKKIIDKNRRENEQKLQLQTENTHLKFQALNASINPHFIFNALYSIQNFVYNNNGNIASNYLGKLSRLIRITLEQADNIEITLKEEIEKIDFYIQLEKMRFGDRITISFTNNIQTNPELIKVPNMIIQPMIENAIIHGLNNRPTNGEIKITFSEKPNQILIYIEDNGIGINRTSIQKKPNHKSIGLKNVRARLALIAGAKITLTDKAELNNGSGTMVEIVLPKN